ncbi:hypothetical protein NORO109296_25785 [Nocardiopsis rhodophaea]
MAEVDCWRLYLGNCEICQVVNVVDHVNIGVVQCG